MFWSKQRTTPRRLFSVFSFFSSLLLSLPLLFPPLVFISYSFRIWHYLLQTPLTRTLQCLQWIFSGDFYGASAVLGITWLPLLLLFITISLIVYALIVAAIWMPHISYFVDRNIHFEKAVSQNFTIVIFNIVITSYSYFLISDFSLSRAFFLISFPVISFYVIRSLLKIRIIRTSVNRLWWYFFDINHPPMKRVNGIDTNEIPRKTELMLQSNSSDMDYIHILIENSANVNQQDNEGMQHADVDMTDNSGKTALIYACRASHSQLVERLVSHGANTYFMDKNGKSAYDYLKGGSDDTTIIELLNECEGGYILK